MRNGQPRMRRPVEPAKMTMRHGLEGVWDQGPRASINQGEVVSGKDKTFQQDMSSICGDRCVDVVMQDVCGVAVRCTNDELSYADCRKMRAIFEVTPQIVEDDRLQLDIQLKTAFPIPSDNPNWTRARPESLAALTNCNEFHDALKSAARRWESNCVSARAMFVNTRGSEQLQPETESVKTALV